MPNVYMYVVDRDFGFAPNPFHNMCTLATCKPDIRRVAKVGDWIIGMGGKRLRATGRCIFAMKTTRSVTFDEYWGNSLYRHKKPLRNGSLKTIVGDNIYHRVNGNWHQSNSHHSYPDGTPNPHNILNDTRTNSVLVSEHFFYFGAAAVEIPTTLLDRIGYRNSRGHRKFTQEQAQPLISFLAENFHPNVIYGDPFDFEAAKSRYSVKNNKITPHT
ncbi:hypothetical protein [Pseudomonas panipatensis]|uniref:Nucleotide modification associated domain-containing protein n=1 Tax=Pseudomonas panipatensis TaxID=428992 RepID=A0A1G8JDL3_9PSED|nr:hypothetical protein [Pseudomonas panipatensis]SDI29141.1 hypothetical protein SAMN05216272_107316 [Pseudomonas panipatensis]SMP50976.1 hypothetical protein SAMN06295951_102548 [Pseudomonas panipatensis]